MVGRQEDIFWVPGDSGQVIPLLPIAVGIQVLAIPTVQQYQIRQEEPNRIRVLFVPLSDVTEQPTRDQIRLNFRQFLSRFGLADSIRLEIERVDTLQPEPSGKFRRIVSLVRSN